MKFPQQNINQSETGIGGPKLPVELDVYNKNISTIQTFQLMKDLTKSE